jgi:hypothetical protein
MRLARDMAALHLGRRSLSSNIEAESIEKGNDDPSAHILLQVVRIHWDGPHPTCGAHRLPCYYPKCTRTLILLDI